MSARKNEKPHNPRLERDYFERLYENDPDPWRFQTSDYEREKYTRTLTALGSGNFENALEIGCSIGVFTRMISARCTRLLAVDASEIAVASALERTGDLPNVTVERCTLPEEMPGGEYDLIVASEILYYLPRDTMLDTLSQLEDALLPGGLFIAVHWRPRTQTYPLQGEEVHALISSNTRMRHVSSGSEPEYLLDVYEAVSEGDPT